MCVSVFSQSLSTFAAPRCLHLFCAAAAQGFNDHVCGGGGGGGCSGVFQRPRRQGHGLTGVHGGPSGLQSSGGAAAQCVHSGLEGDRRDIAGVLRGGGGGGGRGQPFTGTTKKDVIDAVTSCVTLRRRPSGLYRSQVWRQRATAPWTVEERDPRICWPP